MSFKDRDSFYFVAKHLSDLIRKGKIKLEIGGHFQNCKCKPCRSAVVHQIEICGLFDYSENEGKSDYVKGVIDGKNKPSEWVKFESPSFQCDECGEDVVLEFNGKKLRCLNPCKYPKGIPPYDIELNVPSGKMVVANDLRKWWKVVGDYAINFKLNMKKTTEKYAEVGMAHAFVSNTCPGVYKINNKKFVIGCAATNTDTLKGGKRVGGICTDLWWYSIVDYDDFVNRLGTPEKSGIDVDVVECKPGVYRFRHRHNLDEFVQGEEVFTDIDWVRKSDPVKNLSKEYENLNFTAEQIVADAKARYPDLFSDVRRVADHLMCTLGGGYDYHKNGWLGTNPDLKMDAPGLEIPIFKGAYNWYPLSEHSFLLCAAGVGEDYSFDGIKSKDIKLNDSFLSLAFNVAHCISKYGADAEENNTPDNKARAKETQRLGKRALKALVKKYPDKVPNYVKKYLKDKK